MTIEPYKTNLCVIIRPTLKVFLKRKVTKLRVNKLRSSPQTNYTGNFFGTMFYNYNQDHFLL